MSQRLGYLVWDHVDGSMCFEASKLENLYSELNNDDLICIQGLDPKALGFTSREVKISKENLEVFDQITEFIFDQCTELHVVSTVTKSKFSVKTKRLIKCALDRQVDVFYHKLEPDKHEPNS